MKNILSRRELVKNGTVVIGGLSIFGLAACKDKKPGEATSANTTAVKTPSAPANAAAGGDPLISEDHSVASSLKYVHDGSTVDPKLKVEKSGVAGKDQNCLNCNFYKAVEGKDYGTCAVIPVPGKHVAAKGWCQTWAKKA